MNIFTKKELTCLLFAFILGGFLAIAATPEQARENQPTSIELIELYATSDNEDVIKLSDEEKELLYVFTQSVAANCSPSERSAFSSIILNRLLDENSSGTLVELTAEYEEYFSMVVEVEPATIKSVEASLKGLDLSHGANAFTFYSNPNTETWFTDLYVTTKFDNLICFKL